MMPGGEHAGDDCAALRAEIDIGTAAENVKTIKKLAGPGVKVFAVVKADAYAHGAVETARAFAAGGAEYLCVATPSEGIELRNAGIKTPVLVLNPARGTELRAIAEYGLTLAADDAGQAEKFAQVSAKLKRPARVHAEIDTGMGRSGILPSRATREILKIAGAPGLEIEGIFTHFSCAEEDIPDFTAGQLKKFNTVLLELRAAGIRTKFTHAANSAGILRFPESAFNAVRPGLLLYGISPVYGRPPPTGRVLTLKTEITRVRELPAGSCLSYGRTYRTAGPSSIATLPAGYADGYDRRLSNRAFALVGGRRAPLVGRICMDRCLADITGIGAGEGDEAVLVGTQGRETVTIEELARQARTIPNEFVCRLGKRIRRIYL